MTAQEIFDMAIQESNLNDADLIPTDEWLDFLVAYERELYLDAAAENPDFFGYEGNTNARAASTDSWSLTTAPGNIASIQRVEVAAITGSVTGVVMGDEVNVVSIREPDAEIAPRIYIRNKTAYEYNSELQDDSSNFVTRLKVFYSYLPGDKTAATDTMDLPDEFNLLLVYPLASLMAMRDQRPEEAALLEQKAAVRRAAFMQQVKVFDEGTKRSMQQIQAAVPRPGV